MKKKIVAVPIFGIIACLLPLVTAPATAYATALNATAPEEKGGLMVILTAAVVVAVAVVLFLLFSRYKQKANTTEKIVLSDQLTGLSNWSHIQQRYPQLTSREDWVYLLIRMPDFKRISTVFGYPLAARLLRDIAKELSTLTSENEMSVHVSEDCFALLLTKGTSTPALENRINQLFQRLQAIEVTDGTILYNYRVNFVGGAYKIDKQDNELAVVNRRANAVIETRSPQSNAVWTWYDLKIAEKINLQDSLMPDILEALKNDQFIPFFQPQYNVTTKEIIGAEVLARWKHPTHGTVLPGVFVPLLEASGCVLELDLIMLEQACKMIHSWLENGLLPVHLSVNISRLNIHRQDFFDRVVSIVHKYDIPPNLIMLELGEASIAENSEKVMEIGRRMKEEGFMLSMDDFGVGASLNVLHEIPLDVIKLARSFLLNFEQSGDRAVVVLQHMIHMIHGLGIHLVAEGIETAEQEQLVKDNGCTQVQGFYYSKPMAGEDFEQLMFHEN